jgi:hypothetical protein
MCFLDFDQARKYSLHFNCTSKKIHTGTPLRSKKRKRKKGTTKTTTTTTTTKCPNNLK